ncbi:hypothetical protein [Cellulomonas sp. HZM]|uniref:hypothetical protein n=1 Tax=Cellulomonas sp. HZM TaxID=1454010 RepID=UPI00054EFC35|nr:hypothetical protein [Cellulomonas sp. HZM]
MSDPTTSLYPAPVSTSDAAVSGGETNVVRFSKRVRDWLNGLTPSGATVFDTGAVACTIAGGFTGSLSVRRIGKQVFLQGLVSGTFAANTTTTVAIIPSAFLPTGVCALAVTPSSGEPGWGWASGSSISVRKPTAGSTGVYITAAWVQA